MMPGFLCSRSHSLVWSLLVHIQSALVCIGQKGTKITHRHDGATDALHVSTIHAGGLSYNEPRDLSGNGNHTRPDLQLVLNGRQLLVDVTIRHPACKTNILHGSARQQLAAAHKGEAEKKAKYAAMAKTKQAEFLPFAVETYGGLGKAARKLRKRIASSAEEGPQMLSEKEVMRELRGSCWKSYIDWNDSGCQCRRPAR